MCHSLSLFGPNMRMSYLTSLNPQLLKNIAYVGSFKHFSVQFFLHVFCNSTKTCANSSACLNENKNPNTELAGSNGWGGKKSFQWSKRMNPPLHLLLKSKFKTLLAHFPFPLPLSNFQLLLISLWIEHRKAFPPTFPRKLFVFPKYWMTSLMTDHYLLDNLD